MDPPCKNSKEQHVPPNSTEHDEENRTTLGVSFHLQDRFSKQRHRRVEVQRELQRHKQPESDSQKTFTCFISTLRYLLQQLLTLCSSHNVV